MKFSFLPLLLAGACTITQLVSANPIRIVITGVSSNLRFGHAVAHGDNNPNVAHIPPLPIMASPVTQVDDAGRQRKPQRPCGGMRAKANAISNALRKALGLPVIEMHPSSPANGEKEVHDGPVHILPMPFIGTPINAESQDEVPERQPHHPHSKGKGKHHCGSFLRRMHKALMTLGPWEGRAVAFVIGCGLGVLLRMVWVLCVITYRTIRGERDEELEYSQVLFHHHAEEFMVPPPVYNDEKVETVDNKPPAL